MAEETNVVEATAVEQTVPLTEVEPENIEDAVRLVIANALAANGLVRGLSEVTRALHRGNAKMAVLAEDCEDEDYKKLVSALAKQGNIDLINIEERAKLAQWAGLTRTKMDGEVKTLKCSCVAISDFGERSRALDYLIKQLSQ